MTEYDRTVNFGRTPPKSGAKKYSLFTPIKWWDDQDREQTKWVQIGSGYTDEGQRGEYWRLFVDVMPKNGVILMFRDKRFKIPMSEKRRRKGLKPYGEEKDPDELPRAVY